jgi:uncharacterized protein
MRKDGSQLLQRAINSRALFPRRERSRQQLKPSLGKPNEVQVLRAAQRRPMPWKNGTGVTFEVAVSPPGSGLEEFDWRISMAQVRVSGLFSVFPGIDRRLAVLEGCLSLTVDARAAVLLDATTSALEFAGDAVASAEVVRGPVTDLNVMTRRGRFRSRMTRHHTHGSVSIAFEPRTAIVIALTGMGLQQGAVQHQLEARDAALIEASSSGSFTVTAANAGAATFYLVELHRW